MALAAPAPASASYSATCHVQGTIAATVGTGPSSGSYSLNEFLFLCELEGSGGEKATATLDFTSSGTFNNTSCGTGKWSGTASESTSVIASNPGGDPEGLAGQLASTDLSYDITVNDFVGYWLWRNVQGGGYVVFQPDTSQPGNPLGGTCTNGFKVSGILTIGKAPPPPPPPLVDPGGLGSGQGTPSSSEPSQACQGAGWTQINPQPVNVGTGNPFNNSGDLGHVWLYLSHPPAPNDNKVAVCVRVQGGGSTNAGGRLEVDPAGSPGVTLAQPLANDMNGCTVAGPHSDDGTTWDIHTSPIGSNPVSICVTVQGSTTRVTLGTQSGTSSPIVHWYPDSGTPVSETQFP